VDHAEDDVEEFDHSIVGEISTTDCTGWE
jgi:hypothetical protein